jgi:hypothetical protein
MNYLVELRKSLEQKLEEANGHILKGSPSDFAEYRQMVGVAAGLEHALVELNEMIARIAKSEDQE